MGWVTTGPLWISEEVTLSRWIPIASWDMGATTGLGGSSLRWIPDHRGRGDGGLLPGQSHCVTLDTSSDQWVSLRVSNVGGDHGS